ncbi:MAG: DNA repair protein RecN [Thermodesulfovibrionia bacterium]
MLRELHIKNLAIIDDLTIEFDKGLNVLTGETGAGKSIIINALSIAIGERASSELIRSGEKEGVVEAFFDIPIDVLDESKAQSLNDMGIGIDDGLILKRIVSLHGRSRAYINNSITTIPFLADLTNGIIDIHGQYEHQSLLSVDTQLRMLDAYGGLINERNEISELYERLTGLKNELSSLLERERERAERIDLLRYQLNEIRGANLTIGEEEELLEEERVLSNVLRLTELANRAYDSIYLSDSSCITNLSRVISDLKDIVRIDSSVSFVLKSIEDVIPLLKEASQFLRDYRERLNVSPQRLESLQERLHLIGVLKRKYGSSIEEIVRYGNKIEAEIEELEHSEERLEGLRVEIDKLREAFTEKVNELSMKRRDVARKLEKEVIRELSMLSMPDSRFKIDIRHENGDDTIDGLRATDKGIDYVEFLISTNKGEELKPLARVASGGELSRIMLALKGLLTKGDAPVLVFDEIDAGIGGMTAEAVGRRLKALSKEHQVICITHLPQIASFADRHLLIQKMIKGKRTTVEVKDIHGEERIREIARMLSGGITDTSLKHAMELLNRK